MARARTVVDVILGEAVRGTPEQRYRDMRAIASVMVNRANALGVPLEDVVQNANEFNAYGRPLPAGVNAFRSMAEQALTDVLQNGPANNATFYATPAASGNLPNGLVPVDQTTGHVYYTDPLNRAIGTAVGYRRPDPLGYQQISQIDENNIPTPSPAPRGLLDAPQTETAGLIGPAAFDAGRFGAPAPGPEFDMGRFGSPVPTATAAEAPSFDAGRFGPPDAVATSFDVGRFGSMTPMNVDAIASAAGMSPRQPAQATSQAAQNFDTSRFGTMTSQPQGMSGLRAALTTQKAQLSAPQSSGLLGTAQAGQPAQASAPSSASLAEQRSQYGAGQQAMREAMAQRVAEANLAADVADQQSLLASVKTSRLPAAAPAQPEYIDPVVSAQPATTQPSSVVQAPSIATAPASAAQPSVPSGTLSGSALGALVDRQMKTRSLLGGIGGGLLGGALLGPVGALAGGYFGRQMGAKTYYPPAPKTAANQPPKQQGQKLTRDNLSQQGRDLYDSSKQVRDAVKSGKPGLW